MSDFPNIDLDELAAELRQAVSREIRWEAEDVESDALKMTLRRRSLSDVVTELMNRGDTVSFITPLLTVTGTLSHCRDSLAILETPSALVSANLAGPVIVRLIEKALRGGASSTGGSGSFKARLSELEMSKERVAVVTPTTEDIISGQIGIVGTDHILLVGSGAVEWYIPIPTIALVVQAR